MPLLRAITPVPAFVRIQTVAYFVFERIDGHGVRQVRQHVPHCQLLRFLDEANDILHITGCCLSNHMKSTSDRDRNQIHVMRCHKQYARNECQLTNLAAWNTLETVCNVLCGYLAWCSTIRSHNFCRKRFSESGGLQALRLANAISSCFRAASTASWQDGWRNSPSAIAPTHYLFTYLLCIAMCHYLSRSFHLSMYIVYSYIRYLYLNLYLYVLYLYHYIYSSLCISICIDLNLCVSICAHRYLLHLCIYLSLSKL